MTDQEILRLPCAWTEETDDLRVEAHTCFGKPHLYFSIGDDDEAERRDVALTPDAVARLRDSLTGWLAR
jgi:hypothetical protein